MVKHMAKSGFNPSQPVRDPKNLYGWNRPSNLLDYLVEYAQYGTSFLLYGERRSGKTSLLFCLQARLRELPNFTPVYIDSHLPCQKETAHAYYSIFRYIIQAIEENDNLGPAWLENNFREPYSFYLKDQYDDEDGIGQPRFYTFLKQLSHILKRNSNTVLLMFDEYETLPEYFPGIETTFFNIFRTLQSEFDEGGIAYVLAGAYTITEIAGSRWGSPQFNLTSTTLPVGPLEKEDFYGLWRACVESSSPEARRNMERHETDAARIYELCGGRPAFAKALGLAWSCGEAVSVDTLNRWFEDIFHRQPEDAQKLLMDAASGHIPGKYGSDVINRLKALYLLEGQPPDYKITGELWRKFLLERGGDKAKAEIFKNAGELAKMIIREKLVGPLLEMLHGEYKDWLEFKSAVLPTKEYRKKDEKERGKKIPDSLYCWHVAKAILAMRNTRGGLILIGVKDNGEIEGVPRTGAKNDGDFIRAYAMEPLGRKEFNIDDRNSFKLDRCEWDLFTGKWVGFEGVVLDGKFLIAVVVSPVPHLFDYKHAVTALENGNKKKEIHFIRTRGQNTEDVWLSGLDEKKKEINDWNMDDLTDFWAELQTFVHSRKTDVRSGQ